MSKKKEIDNISTKYAKLIVDKYSPGFRIRKNQSVTEIEIRTKAREICRNMHKSPKELIA